MKVNYRRLVFPLSIGIQSHMWRHDEHSPLLSQWMHANRASLVHLVQRYGAVLLRDGGGGEADAHTFSECMRGLDLLPFESGCSAAPRRTLAPHVATANEAPATEVIPFHHEMAQCHTSPDYIAFYCTTPPAEGGSTPIVLSREVARHVWDHFPTEARTLQRRGIRYARVLPPLDDLTSPIGKSWMNSYDVATRAEAERAVEEAGDEWEWLEGDNLRVTTGPRRVFGEDLWARPTFFNSAVAAREGWKDTRNHPASAVVFADDHSPLDPNSAHLFDAASRYMHARARRMRWQRGDLLFLDNSQVLHARERFTPPRKILASLWGSSQGRFDART